MKPLSDNIVRRHRVLDCEAARGPVAPIDVPAIFDISGYRWHRAIVIVPIGHGARGYLPYRRGGPHITIHGFNALAIVGFAPPSAAPQDES